MNKEFLEKEYLEKKKSMQEIAKEMGVSPHKIVYWMEKYKILRRTWSEATYVKRNQKGDPFQIKKVETEEEKTLFALAIGLYLGEGSKRNNSKMALGNSDPLIIRIFLKFLKEICGVRENKIKLELNIYDDVSIQDALEYWEMVTELSASHFYKPFIRKARKGNYKRWSRYGTLTIVVSNTKLHRIVLGWCETFLRKFGNVIGDIYLECSSRGSSVAEHLHGKQAVGGSIPLLGSMRMCS